jgi:hypothetical protein
MTIIPYEKEGTLYKKKKKKQQQQRRTAVVFEFVTKYSIQML